jgi:Undecaprenyl-phosphate glucose phosphotransferase
MNFRILDCFAALLATVLSTILIERVGHELQTYLYLSIAITVLFLALDAFLYDVNLNRRPTYKKAFTLLLFNWFLILLLLSAFLFVLKLGDNYSRVWVSTVIVTGFLFTLTTRVIYLSNLRGNSIDGRAVVIVGTNKLARTLHQRMNKDSDTFCRPVAYCDVYVDLGKKDENRVLDGVPVLQGLTNLLRYIEDARVGRIGSVRAIEEIWIALPLNDKNQLVQLVRELKNTAAKVYYVPEMHDLGFKKYDLETMFNLPVIDWVESTSTPIESNTKRILDVTIASFGILLVWPLIAILAVLIRLESPGPALFVQTRYGLDGKEFNLYKLRSMNTHDIERNKIGQATMDDSRVTRIGKFIRKYSLDELPQFFNVIIGNMSIVGPRPHANVHNEYYRDKIDGYMYRHSTKPGITGLAQVNGYRGETPKLEDMKNRIKYDIEYINNWSLASDMKILLKTISVVVSAKNAY